MANFSFYSNRFELVSFWEQKALPSLFDILQFRKAMEFMENPYPFSSAFGLVGNFENPALLFVFTTGLFIIFRLTVCPCCFCLGSHAKRVYPIISSSLPAVAALHTWGFSSSLRRHRRTGLRRRWRSRRKEGPIAAQNLPTRQG